MSLCARSGVHSALEKLCGVQHCSKPLGNDNTLVRNRDNRGGLQEGGCDCVDAVIHSQAVGLWLEQGGAG